MKLILTAGAIIFDTENRVLLVLRPADKKIFPNTWSFPGGKLEENETLKDCVIREVKEETNLDFSPTTHFNFTEYISNSTHNISHLYTGTHSWVILDNTNAKWFTYKDLQNIDIAFDYKEILFLIYENWDVLNSILL